VYKSGLRSLLPVHKAASVNLAFLKYGCAIVAVAYFAAAVLPTSLLWPHASEQQLASAWLTRAAMTVNFLLFGAIFYGIQKRTPIYWKLIPFITAALFLANLIPPLVTLISLSRPWLPFLFIIGFACVFFLIFMMWWRNQRGYFASRLRS
jgi:phosphoglycerol transferase MdoB-like AlkP superfamily enzyme